MSSSGNELLSSVEIPVAEVALKMGRGMLNFERKRVVTFKEADGFWPASVEFGKRCSAQHAGRFTRM